MNFWQTLPKPFFILAPMEDVTDSVFRRIIASCGRPDVFFTEFTNVEGIFSHGEAIVSQRLSFTPSEKPLVAQIWGLEPSHFFKAARKLAGMGFDGIDINMGCPQKSITKRGACSALINNHSLAKEIILATKEGAGVLPVSVKTRLGFKHNQREEWISFLLSFDLSAITIHARTATEMSSVPARWDEVGHVVKMRNEMRKDTLIIGNGDVTSREDGAKKAKTYRVDGIMIGRGVFYNPWIFDTHRGEQTASKKQRLGLLVQHIQLFEKSWGKNKPFQIMKKYIKIYVSGFDGANGLRIKLMGTHSYTQAYKVINEAL